MHTERAPGLLTSTNKHHNIAWRSI